MAIFKYFTHKEHALALVNKGVLLLRPLSYFRVQDDKGVRGDVSEGILTYAPQGGLLITKEDGTVLTLEGGAFTSSAKQDDIFVYCASNQLSGELSKRFNSPFCVEIDPEQLVSRLRARAYPASQLDYEQLVSGVVDYRPRERGPGVDWALPEKLAFVKPEDYAWQDEFRIAIGRRNTFAVENVECTLELGPKISEATAPRQTQLTLKVGKLASFAKLHQF